MALAALIVSIFAILVACASLAWQVASFRLSGARLTVTINPAIVTVPITSSVVSVKAMNTGRQAVEVNSVWFEAKDGSRFFVPRFHPVSNPIPGTVQPGHALTVLVPREALVEAARERGTNLHLAAGVSLGTGREVKSKGRVPIGPIGEGWVE